MGILILAGFALLLLLIMVGATWGINFAMKRMIGDKHHDLEEIVTTGQAPARWRLPYERRLQRLRLEPGQAEKASRLERDAVRDYVRRLDGLVGYIQSSSLVDSEETRETLLSELRSARARWLRDVESPGTRV
jgi:hypothetical protein